MTQQSKIDSFMEAACNVALGFVTSMVMIPVINWIMGVHMAVSQQMGFVGLFTITSVLRSYLIRRAFNGRSVWETFKCFGNS